MFSGTGSRSLIFFPFIFTLYQRAREQNYSIVDAEKAFKQEIHVNEDDFGSNTHKLQCTRSIDNNGHSKRLILSIAPAREKTETTQPVPELTSMPLLVLTPAPEPAASYDEPSAVT